MWLVFFCNITAGIAIIGFQSPLFQDLWRKLDGSLDVRTLAAYGGTLIAVTSLFNGVGRFFWGGLSDKIGRNLVFTLMLGTQVGVFVALGYVANPWLFGGLLCYVMLCYGGGFGTMPSFVSDVFGSRQMPAVYGTILTAWSMGGIVGPQLVAYMKDHYKAEAAQYTFFTASGFLAVGFVLSLLASNKRINAI
jgi:OFA family oxalate/formate antiporter-like MFS transporter